MENKSILIQSDEVTKNMMSELQQDMIDSLSKVSKSMTEDVIEKLKPIEKNITNFKREFEEFRDDNEDFEDKMDELKVNFSNVTKSIESIIQESIEKIMGEQNEILNYNINKLLSYSEEIKSKVENNKEQMLNAIEKSKDEILEEIKTIEKIDERVVSLEGRVNEKIELSDQNIQVLEVKAESLHKNVEKKIALLGKYIVREENINKDAILAKIDEINVYEIQQKVESFKKTMENTIFNSQNNIIERVNIVNEKINQKNDMMEIICRMEKEFTDKINSIQEEVEWTNRSFFSRFFGKKIRDN